MFRYSDSFIDLVRERVDLLELVGRQVTLKRQGASWLGLCPFHTEKTPSFNVRPGKGFKCFGCGVGGDAFEFLMKLKGIDFIEALEELATMSGIPLPEHQQEDPQAVSRRQLSQRLLDLMAAAKDFYQAQLDGPVGLQARRYLQQRGLKPETIARFGLGYASGGWRQIVDRFGGGEAAVELLEQAGLVIRKSVNERAYDRFRDRIIFPIQDLKGRCIAFGGRIMGEGNPKYLNSPETDLFQKGKVLYGLDGAQEAIQKEGRVIVVEGYMDRLALVDHGIESVVATLGTAITTDHLRLLWQRTRKIYFCFDGDAAGEKAAWRGLELVLDGLEADRHALFLFLPQGQDPDQVVRQEGARGFLSRVETGITPMEFLIRKLGSGLHVGTPEGRAALVHRARPLLSKVKDPLLRELYAQTLSQRLQIPAHFAHGAVEPERGPMPLPMIKPQVRGGAAYRLPSSSVVVSERDHEQALLALVLRQPRFVQEREEELMRLKLENGQLSELLTELIELGRTFAQPPESWPLDRLPIVEMSHRAQMILAAEETRLEFDEQELDGCLVSIHLKALRSERQRLMRQIDREGDADNSLIRKSCALKEEEKRVLGDKSAREKLH